MQSVDDTTSAQQLVDEMLFVNYSSLCFDHVDIHNISDHISHISIQNQIKIIFSVAMNFRQHTC